MARKTPAGAPGLIDLLKDAVTRDGRSLNQIAREARVAPSQLSYFMQGKRTLTLPVAEKVMNALRLRVALVNEGPAPEPPAPKRRRKGKEE